MTLEQAQDIIADPSFRYKGDSLVIIEIVNAIKEGYRLARPNDATILLQKRLYETAFNNRVEFADACVDIADNRVDTWVKEIFNDNR